MGASANCPSCGAGIDFGSSANILVVCPYCRSSVVRTDKDLKNLGRMADLLEDASPIQIGTSGRHRARAFVVVGRIQMSYGQGTWNEWCLGFDGGEQGWLGEAQGMYTVTQAMEKKIAIPPADELAPGTVVEIGGRTLVVGDRRTARCVAAEGQLPRLATPGFEALLVDLGGERGEFATVDFGDDPPTVYLGEVVPFQELALGNLREFEGW